MKNRLLQLSIALFFLTVSNAFSQVYVDVNSLKSKEKGDITEPYRTIEKGIQNISSGQTLTIMKGNYREAVEFSEKEISIYASVGDVTIGTEVFIERNNCGLC